jgi:hypothetical protein
LATVKIKGASASTTLDGSGNGRIKIGPQSSREIWHPVNAHVAANTGAVTNEASCLIYVGQTVEPNNFRDGTLSGSSGDTSEAINNDEIKNGEYVHAVWSGGDPGVNATLNVTGDKDV